MQTNQQSTYCVIMAGGIGTRFWPMSTSQLPKQFHDVLGIGKSLIQQTYDRLLKITDADKIYVITDEQYTQLTLEQLPQLQPHQIIAEPIGMNTAPCALYSALKIAKIDPKAQILLCPSDHLILEQDKFVEKVELALQTADETQGLITLGIQPTRPDTGYGYIQFKENENSLVKKVKTFTEKPNLEIAKSFLASGDFLWNSGIFVWSAKAILQAFDAYTPIMLKEFRNIEPLLNTPDEKAAIAKIYPTLQKISIDVAIMEKAENVYVIPSSFGWSDLGTWSSLYEQGKKDTNQNTVIAQYTKLTDAQNNMVFCNTDKAIVVDSLQNYIIVDTPQALLIYPMDKDQEVKNIVQELKLAKGEKYT